MYQRKKLKDFTLIMLLLSFVAAGTVSACRDQKKQENTEEQAEHPEGEEHPTEDGAKKDEHPESEEHPAKEGGEHPAKDSVSG